MGYLFIFVSLAAVGGGTYAFFRLRRMKRDFSMTVFGTESLAEGFAQQESEYAETPKSVSAMTSIYLPRILVDFPDFNIDEFKAKAENLIKQYLIARGSQDKSVLNGASSDIIRQTELEIADDKLAGVIHKYKEINIYRTEITNYIKKSGTCVVKLQSSVGHYEWVERDGEIIKGSDTIYKQTRYDTEYVYVQNEADALSVSGNSVGVSCPNCGAPITNLGDKKCSFCGAAVKELNIKVWSLNSVREHK